MKGMDLFADALAQFYETGRANLRIERDDGYLRREDVSWYFTVTPGPAPPRGWSTLFWVSVLRTMSTAWQYQTG
jgi:hypothetical protein